MVREAFRRFSIFGGVGVFSTLFLFASCATASSANDLKPPPMDIPAELSSTEVVPGTVLTITLNVPPAHRKDLITGNFEGIEFPFFPVDQEATSVKGEDVSKTQSGVYEAILGVPYERKAGPAVVNVSMGEGPTAGHLELKMNVLEGNYPSEALHVDGRRVNPTRKDLRRIKKEQAEVAVIYKHETQQKYWKGPFELPIHSRITSPFGTKRTFNGELKSHPGLDLKAPVGTHVYSAAPGMVVMAKSLFYTGNTVMIDHGYGVITLYAHLSKLRVKKGQLVGRHDLVGLSGKTGRVNGPHLHWQAVVHRVKINPLGLTQVMIK